MFRRLSEHGLPVRLTIEGRPVTARSGDSVAAAMLAAGFAGCRETPVSGSARGPFCLMGVCFDCLVTIDGVANRQGCLTPVHEGMTVSVQRGRRDSEHA
jgi:D-hydroxyproline dehydrogenase subunit gamma